MKNLILIWALLLPYLAFGQATNSDTQYRNDGETLINGSFEQGKKGYTFTVGSGSTVWSAQSTTKLTGRAMQLTLSAQTFSFKSATTQGVSLQNQNGYIEVYLSASLSGAEFCPLVDGVSAPTTTPNECQPIIAGVGFKPYGIQKVFGASSLNYEIRGVSNASYTGVIYLDDGSVAKSNRVNGVKLDTVYSARILASGSIGSTSKGGWISCTRPLTGEYTCTITGFTVVPNCSGMTDEATQGITITQSLSSTASTLFLKVTKEGVGYFNKDFSLICHKSGVDNLNSTAQVFNTTGGWFIDANIGGALVNLGTAGVSSFTEITNTSLDLVVNTSKGSAPAEIPCISGTASVGLTCNTPAVAESVGISFIPPKTGKYRACFAVSHQVNNIGVTLQIVETSNTSSTILTEGSERFNFYSATTTSVPVKLCSNFTFSDTSKKTLRLMFEQTAGGATSQVLADRAATEGQRDLHITVEPIVENIQASLQGMMRVPQISGEADFFHVKFGGSSTADCTTSPCPYILQTGKAVDPVNGITKSGTAGDYFITTLRTYSLLSCTHKGYSPGIGFAYPQTPLVCQNCNGGNFTFSNPAESAGRNVNGVIECIGVH